MVRIAKMLIAVKKIIVLFIIIIFGTLSFPIARADARTERGATSAWGIQIFDTKICSIVFP